MAKKILIAYYSRRGENYCHGEIRDLKIGNTELVAKKIASLITADLFQIDTVKKYPISYMETTEVAKKELQENARPALTDTVKNMQEYGTIILGYPSWWGTMPMAVFTFLEQYDFSNKTIIPFCTNEGSGLGSSVRDLKKLCSKANILSGVSINGTKAPQADSQVQQIANMAKQTQGNKTIKTEKSMNDFIFQNTTKVYFGKNLLSNLSKEILAYGKRVLMVYGGGSIKRNGLYDKVTSILKDAGISIFELSGVEPNPRHTTVNRGAAICRKENIDLILAVGGGSSIDCSKGIAATALSKTDDVWDLITRKEQYDKALPIAVVLTMSATGSEMDAGAVISNMDINGKFALQSPVLQPKVAFENPEITYSVPAYQTACGSCDIMSHILDLEYFNQQGSMDMLKRLQEEVLKTVIKYAPIAISEPKNYESRANLMWASSWALNGFLYGGVAQPPVCHCMEHELSAYYDITHGHGLAILIPRWLKYVLDEQTAADIYRFGINCFGVDSSLSQMQGANKAIEALSNFFFNTLGLKSHLSELGIDNTHFADMAKSACRGGILKAFKPLTQKDIEAIYTMCL